MLLDPLPLLDVCNRAYYYPMYRTGPDGRDGALLTKVEEQAVVAFRGTLTEGAAAWLDWASDLRAELVCREGFPGLVHAGFEAKVHNLLALLPRFDVGTPPIICGHSSGGAQALLFGVYLSLRFGIHAKVVTFAAPRAGNADFAAAASALLDIDRYENPHDIVPKLPPVDYAATGYLITPPAQWQPPRGIRENHSLATGYRPWIEANRPQPRAAQRTNP